MTPPETAPGSSPTRNEIIRIASELFYLQGFHATGIKQIIDSAGIAKGTFYSHFVSKEELGVAWLKGRHLQWSGWLEDHLATKATPRTRILGIFEFLEKWMKQSNYRGCAFLNTASEIPSGDHPMRAEVTSHKLSLRKKIHELVRAHFGPKSSQRIDQKADIIFLLFEGSLVEAQNFLDPWPIQTARRETEALLTT